MQQTEPIRKNNASLKQKKGKADWIIFFLTYMLVLIGLLMVYSSSSIQAQFDRNSNYDSMFFLKKQFKFVILGTIALFIGYKINYRLYKKFAWYIYGLNIFLLVLTRFTPLGTISSGGKRWLNLGFMSFQTSEFSKFAIIIIIAYFISQNKNRMNRKSSIIIPLVFAGITFLLILIQPSLSAGLILMITAIAMLFIGGMSYFHTFVLFVTGVLGTYIMSKSAAYRQDRINSYLDPFNDITGKGYQIVNSILAIASGNLMGVGYGKSTQKYFYIPQPQNDFIFSIYAEEFGFIGCILLIALFLVLIYRIFSLFISVEDVFAKMIVAGIGLLIGIQMFLHIAVVSGLVPNTGIGLPFISYGGTSIMMFLFMIGILLNISKNRKALQKIK